MSDQELEHALWSTIRTRQSFERVYYFHGEEEYLKEQLLRELIDSAVESATRDFNLDVRNAASVDPETLGSLLGTPPMMAERRVVVLRDVAALGKENRAALDRYLEDPAPDIVLILLAAGGEKAKPDKDLEGKSFAFEFKPLSADRIPKWIARHAATEHQASLSDAAIALLHSAVGNDLPTLAAELDKLVSYCGGAEINEDAVAACVGVRRGETLGDLLDRIANRDASGALELLPHVLSQPKAAGVPIVMALTVQTLALAWGLAMREGGTSVRKLESEYFGFLKSSSGAFTGRPWGEAVKSWLAALGHWDAESLDDALDALLAADIALKETRVSSDEQLLTTLILRLCAGGHNAAPPRRRVAAAGV